MRTSRLTTTIAAAAVVILAGSAVAVAAGDPTPTPPPRIAVVARGDGSNFADALAVGSVAGQLGAPVFTTPATSLSEATGTALTEYSPELVIITGGTAAISADVEAAIESTTGLPADKVVRAAGTTRYETAAEIAAIFDDLDIDPAYLPTGAKAVDSDLLDGLDSTAFQEAGDYLTTADGAQFQPRGDYLTTADAAGFVPRDEIVPFAISIPAGPETDYVDSVGSAGDLTLLADCLAFDDDSDGNPDQVFAGLYIDSATPWTSNDGDHGPGPTYVAGAQAVSFGETDNVLSIGVMAFNEAGDYIGVPESSTVITARADGSCEFYGYAVVRPAR